MRPEPHTENYRQPWTAEGGGDSLPQGRALQLARQWPAGKQVFPTCATGADAQPEHRPHTLHPGELTRATDAKP